MKDRLFTPIRTAAAIATLSILGACGGLSPSLVLDSSSSDSTSSKSDESDSSGPASSKSDASDSGDATDRAERAFAGLTEEENKKNARDFKATLRMGELAKQFEKGELFDAVAAMCGVKIWDKCRVGHILGERINRYPPVAFQKKSGGPVHWYPDFFHDKAEPKWAAKAQRDVRVGVNGDVLLTMLEERCGSPLNTNCQIRRIYNQGYIFTHRETGEVIDPDTLREWSADL